jgi:hypothetical protein
MKIDPTDSYLHEWAKHLYKVNLKTDRVKTHLKVMNKWSKGKYVSNNHIGSNFIQYLL